MISRQGDKIVLENNDLEKIHFEFGESWRVTEEESQFLYENGENFLTYYQPQYTPLFEVPDWSEKALELCGSNQVRKTNLLNVDELFCNKP